jgi:hypothetical protein
MVKIVKKVKKQVKKYPKKTRTRVLELVAMGKSMREIEAMKSMPCAETLCNWKREDSIFAEQWNEALENQADFIDEDVYDKHKAMLDAVVDRDEGGSTHIAALKLYTDTMNLRKAQRKSKVYGKKSLEDLQDGKDIKEVKITYD